MDYGFKFAIGQFVEHVAKIHDPKRSIWPGEGPRMIVIGQLLEVTAGGENRLYRLRLCEPGGRTYQNIIAEEIELRPETAPEEAKR